MKFAAKRLSQTAVRFLAFQRRRFPPEKFSLRHGRLYFCLFAAHRGGRGLHGKHNVNLPATVLVRREYAKCSADVPVTEIVYAIQQAEATWRLSEYAVKATAARLSSASSCWASFHTARSRIKSTSAYSRYRWISLHFVLRNTSPWWFCNSSGPLPRPCRKRVHAPIWHARRSRP